MRAFKTAAVAPPSTQEAGPTPSRGARRGDEPSQKRILVPASLLLHLVFLQHNVGMVLGPGLGSVAEGFGVITVVWTLSIEAVFYAVLPLVASRYWRRPFVGLALAVALSLGWQRSL